MNHPQPIRNAGNSRRGIKTTVIFLCIVIFFIVGGFVYTMVKPRPLSDGALRANNAYMFEQPRDLGEFALLDDENKPFTAASLQHKWTLLFFGYTYCPDICPTTMATLSQFYSKLEPGYAKDTQIVMVSVDPARDTPEKLRQYVRYFNPQFRGVTGEFLALQQFATALNIPFRKVPNGGDNYQIDHSGSIAIIHPNGHYVGFFKAPHGVEKLLQNYQSIRVTHE